MPVLQVLIILAVFGVLLWLFNKYVTMIDPMIKKIINWVAIIAVVIWLVRISGLWNYLNAITV